MSVRGRHPILREGLIAGAIGAVSVAGWFLIVDLIAGRPFFTPAALGSTVFRGINDPAAITVGVEPVVLYTLAHVAVFLALGLVASVLMAETERHPHLAWLLVEFFVVLEFGFYGIVALFFTPLLASLAWINVALGNLLAAGTMGYYLWRARPGLRRALIEQLGGLADG